jgi:hypothetical protein
MWKRFTKEEKKGIIEAIKESIIVGKEDIEINLCYLPALTEAVTAGEKILKATKPLTVRLVFNLLLKRYNIATQPHGCVAMLLKSDYEPKSPLIHHIRWN